MLLLLSAALALAAFMLPGGTPAPPPETEAAPVELPVLPSVAPAALEPLPHPAAPSGLVIPALGVRAPVVRLAAEGAVLTPPADYREAGWWAAGAKPGSVSGHVLITGHTVHTGGGIFDDLGDLRAGDPVEVDTRRGRLSYEVVRVHYLSVTGLAAASSRLFRQDGPARLVLVTCAGWDGAVYHGNTVVVARPVDRPTATDPHTTVPTADPTTTTTEPATLAPTSVPSLVPMLPQPAPYDETSRYEDPMG